VSGDSAGRGNTDTGPNAGTEGSGDRDDETSDWSQEGSYNEEVLNDQNKLIRKQLKDLRDRYSQHVNTSRGLMREITDLRNKLGNALASLRKAEAELKKLRSEPARGEEKPNPEAETEEVAEYKRNTQANTAAVLSLGRKLNRLTTKIETLAGTLGGVSEPTEDRTEATHLRNDPPTEVLTAPPFRSIEEQADQQSKATHLGNDPTTEILTDAPFRRASTDTRNLFLPTQGLTGPFGELLPIGGTARDETIGRYLSSTTTFPDGTLAPPGTHRNPEDPELEKGEEEEQKEEALKEKPPVTKKATAIKKRPSVKEEETSDPEEKPPAPKKAKANARKKVTKKPEAETLAREGAREGTRSWTGQSSGV